MVLNASTVNCAVFKSGRGRGAAKREGASKQGTRGVILLTLPGLFPFRR